ncbi:MAG: hypothetical protein MJY61_00760 [Bacteroidales bacterium]|nr:hypothetical protein [Bacteroidales bacterium]
MKTFMKNMTRISSSVLAAALLVCGLAFTSSCSKENTPQVLFEATFYLGVNPNDAACIYKSGELLYQLGPDSYISGLAVMPDGTVYACGEIQNRSESGEVVSETLAMWKDGQRISKDLGTEYGNHFNKMISAGDKWLCNATLFEAGVPHGIIIENGEVVFRSADNVKFLTMDIGASGDSYVVASEEGTLSLWRISASTREITSTEVIAQSEEGYIWDACLYVGNSDIAVGLNKFNTTDFTTTAYCWVNGGLGLERVEGNSAINSITFFGGYLVLAGHHEKVTLAQDYAEIQTTAVQWVNGYPQDFSYGCTGDSDLRLVMNWNNMFIFQAVEHDGGIQICNNGAALETVNLQYARLSCWDVTVKEKQVTPGV